MASKCDKCEKLRDLQARYERLEIKYNRLMEGEPVSKIHFDLDGEITACGRDLFDTGAYATDEIERVTCRVCHRKWRTLKAQWEKELKQEQRENERKRKLDLRRTKA